MLAETPGFEPGVPYSGYDGLANRWFQPLTHVSRALGRVGPIAAGAEGINVDFAHGCQAGWRALDSVGRAVDCVGVTRRF